MRYGCCLAEQWAFLGSWWKPHQPEQEYANIVTPFARSRRLHVPFTIIIMKIFQSSTSFIRLFVEVLVLKCLSLYYG